MKNEIILYTEENGKIDLKVNLYNDTVWLSLKQLAILFDRNKSTISRHINNIFKIQELDRNSVVADFAITASDGKTYLTTHYNLDLIISLGYRVNSKQNKI